MASSTIVKHHPSGMWLHRFNFCFVAHEAPSATKKIPEGNYRFNFILHFFYFLNCYYIPSPPIYSLDWLNFVLTRSSSRSCYFLDIRSSSWSSLIPFSRETTWDLSHLLNGSANDYRTVQNKSCIRIWHAELITLL